MMLYESEINGLISQWKTRLRENNGLDASYKDALSDCIYELQSLSNQVLSQEFYDSLDPEEIESYVKDMEADSYLSSVEAHENWVS